MAKLGLIDKSNFSHVKPNKCWVTSVQVDIQYFHSNISFLLYPCLVLYQRSCQCDPSMNIDVPRGRESPLIISQINDRMRYSISSSLNEVSCTCRSVRCILNIVWSICSQILTMTCLQNYSQQLLFATCRCLSLYTASFCQCQSPETFQTLRRARPLVSSQ